MEGEKNQTPKTVGRKQSSQLWMRYPFPPALANMSSMFLALSCGAVQVRHRWGTCAGAGAQLCARSTSHSEVPSTPAHQTLPCFPPPALGGNHLLLCVLPAWVELSCCLSISLYQLLDGSCRAATALRKQRQMVLDVRSYGRTTAKAISLNSQQNRFHQR